MEIFSIPNDSVIIRRPQITMRCIASLALVPQNADKLVEDAVVKTIAAISKTHIQNIQICEQVASCWKIDDHPH